MKIEKNRKYKVEKDYIKIFVYISVFSLLFRNSYSTFLLFISIFCTCIAFSLGIIAFCGRSLKENFLYRNIGIGFFIIFIISFIRLVLECCPHLLRNSSFTYYMDVVNFHLEYIVLIIALIIEYLRGQIKEKISISIICNSIFMIAVVYFYCYYARNNILAVFSGFIFILPLVILLWMLVFFDYANLNGDKKRIMYKYILSIVIYQVFTILDIYFKSRIMLLASALRLYSYYLIYILISGNVIRKTYFNMKDKLIEVQLKQKELNKLLKKRNKNLLELEYFIEKSGEKYEEIIDKVSDGVIIFNFDKIYYINKMAMQIMGVSNRGDTIGNKFNEFIEKVYPQISNIKDYKLIKKDIEAIEKGEIESCTFDLSVGEDNQYLIYFFNMNNVTRLVYIKDVTETNKNYEFKRKYEEYKKNEELKNKFYSNISHELRTPINLIYSALQLSEVNIDGNKFEKLNDYNKTIKHNCLRLIRTISNFIDTNKISEGYLKANFQIHNIVPIIEDVSLACYKYIKKIGSKLIFDSVEEELYVKCDKEMIERVMLNILSNSVKFGSDGEKILVTIFATINNVIIKIRNDGCKIDEDVKKHIFDKFTIINKSFNRTTEGSGLGLYLTKELLALQGGRIDLKSDDEFGTEFTIYLPRYYPELIEYKNDELEDIMHPLEEKVDIEFSDIYI